MSDDKIAEIRERHEDFATREVHTPLEVAEGILSGKYTLTSMFMLVNLIEDLIRERDEARAKVERLQSIHASQGHQPSIGPGKPPLIAPDQGSSGRK